MPNVKTYYKSKDGSKSLSANFKVREFACKDGTDRLLVDLEMIYILQKIRDISRRAVNDNSAYRTVSYNKKVGGASNSYHLYGRAFDIKTAGLSIKDICAIANSLGVKGILKYSSFVHIDSRPNKYHYSYVSGKTEDFGKYNIPYQGSLIKVGTKGEETGIVQFKLNSLGYNCGTVDGICGSKTDSAIRAFQRDRGLGVDGKVGILTWNELFN